MPDTAQSTETKALKFSGQSRFRPELRRRVAAHFESTGGRPRDSAAMYRKVAIVLSSFVAAYVGLVFFASSLWLSIPLAAFLGFTMALVGMNVMHDGGHNALSDRPWINRLAAMTLDLIGGSSYVWRWKHGYLHHTYVNITGHDDDIDTGPLARLTPDQDRLFVHRWQHIYIWLLYGFLAIKWHLIDDFKTLILGRIGDQKIPRPRGWDLVTFLGGKVVFFGLAFGLPLLLHSPGAVILHYTIAAIVVGVTLSITFQLAHCVQEARFTPPPEGDTIESAWAIHQVESTIDFSRKSRLICWLVGGLNFQIEHHLLPRISHVNYPALSPIVEETCREFGVTYREHPSLFAGIASHYRWLRKMGRPRRTSDGPRPSREGENHHASNQIDGKETHICAQGDGKQ